MSIADKIDQRVADGKVVPYWRKFFSMWSVRFSLAGFATAFGNALMVAATTSTFRAMLNPLATWLLICLAFLGSMLGSLLKQKGLADQGGDDDANSEHA